MQEEERRVGRREVMLASSVEKSKIEKFREKEGGRGRSFFF